MIEAGEVGAVFKVVDQASVTLTRIAEAFERLDGLIKSVKDQLGTIRLPPGINAQLGRLNEQIDALPASADKAVAGVTGAFGKIDESVNATQERVLALKGEMASLGKTGGGALLLGGAGGGGRGAGGGGSGSRSSGSGRRPGHGPRLGGEVPGINVGPGTIRPEGGNFWEALGIYAIGDAILHTIKSGGELETNKKLLRDKLGASGTEANIAEATKFAIQYATDPKTGVIGSTPAENLKGITDLISVAPTLQAAEKLYPQMMRAATVLEELTGQKADQTMKTLAKGIENTGGGINPVTGELDPDRMQAAVDAAVKTIVAGGGFIDANTLFGYAKQAGGMGRITTDLDAAQNQIITSLIDMSGNRTGTAIAALGRQFLGGKMTFPTGTALSDLGLMPEGHWRKGGTGIIMDPGYDIKGVDEIKDPGKGIGAWLNDVWAPAVKKKFAGEGKEFNAGNIMQESYKDFGQQTGQRLALMFLMNKAQQDRDVALRMGVDPAAAYKGIGEKDYADNVKNLGAAITGFSEVIGGPSTGAAIAGLSALSSAIHGLTDAAAVSPKADQEILTGAGIGVFAATAGWISKFFGGPGVGGVAGWLSKIGPWVGGPLTALAGLGSATSPSEQKVIDGLIEREQKEWAATGRSKTGGGFFLFGKDAAEQNAAQKSLYNAGYGYWDQNPALNSEMGRESARGKALGGLSPNPADPLKSIGPQITAVLQAIPGQVQPSINAVASVGSQLAAAISSIASAARSAVAAIPSGGGGQKVTVKTAINVDGRQLAQVASYHQIRGVRTATNSGFFDAASLASTTDMG